jgi:NAD(P)-dependent dehydrogenase (short-subunit alcohol dehydrogenase family)
LTFSIDTIVLQSDGKWRRISSYNSTHQANLKLTEQTMNNTFTNKVALVTGATSGIGRATAIAFAQAGAKVAVAGRREEEGAQVVREIEQTGGEALFVRTDVAREADVQTLVAETVERFGRLDFAFNNAGIFLDAGDVTQATEDIYDRTMNVNVRGVLYGLKHEIPAILASGGGAIVNNASALGCPSFPMPPFTMRASSPSSA